jgi:hypothetical protein
MREVPKLTHEQLKRFRRWLVDARCYPSYQKAIKATDSHVKCRAVFIKFAPYVGDFEVEGIMDIAEAYMVYDYTPSNCGSDLLIQPDIEPNRICDKVDLVFNEANCGADLIVEIPNRICDLPIDSLIEPNRICKKPRGKQKAQTMRPLLVKLPIDTIERLKALDGTTSEHIRQAIDNYLNTK